MGIFRTKLDFSDNRQVKQRIETTTNLSGATSFGVPFNYLPSGPNLTLSSITQTLYNIEGTFTGNNTTTVYTWDDINLSVGESTLSAITPSNSATTQFTGYVFVPDISSYFNIDGNTGYTYYTGVSYSVSVLEMIDLGGGIYSGSVDTGMFDYISANGLDFTGRTIWVDSSGITRTDRLIITDNPQVGYVWTCIDSEGMGEWQYNGTGSTSGTDVFVTGGTYSAGTSVFINNTGGTFNVTGFNTGDTTLYWYAENTTQPSVTPIATGTGSIALGDGAEALSNDMFVYGVNAGNGATNANYSNFFGPSAGNLATNAYSSNFIGNGAGQAATNASNSNFFGQEAGYGATDANNANFFGFNAGYVAIDASFSNFFGNGAGYQATGASNSNFFGYESGYLATDANNSNFFGNNSGYVATGASNSNFFGVNAGYNAINAYHSNFFGYYAGDGGSGAYESNFLGLNAGNGATDAYQSNFLGLNAGSAANNANNSNFIGNGAGQAATNANNSNFMGASAGLHATDAYQSNFFGVFAGKNAIGSNSSNFIGYLAGNQTTGASNSNFFGSGTGSNAIDASNSNFMGVNAGNSATNASFSNFFGNNAGVGATGASSSNFFGYNAGYQATGASNSIFIGTSTGYLATDSTYSNFFGNLAGYGGKDTSESNFIGNQAGYYASGSSLSNFIGQNAGNAATGSTGSNFLGRSAGYQAIDNNNSNFIGHLCGYLAINASNSNFIGYQAGHSVTGSTYSNFIGFKAGGSFINNNVGSNNIIIGTNISLPSGVTNSINIGGVLFGIETYSTVTGDPATGATASGKIGIGIVTPTEGLDVALNARIRTIGSSASAGALHYDSNGVLTTSTSDERLKSNINQLTNSLDKIKQLRGVTYNWNENLTGQTRIGFVAQEVETVVPELTFINNNSPEKYMGVHYDNITALLVEAIKELASGVTTSNNTHLETQTILAEDNNVELNFNGTQQTAIGGGLRILHAKGENESADLITDNNGNFVTNNDFKPNALTIPLYTPTSSNDTTGSEGNITRDDNYMYLKTSTGWKRTNLENF